MKTEKTSYFEMLGLFCAKRPGRVLGAWGLVALLAVGLSVGVGLRFEDRLEMPGTESQQATDLIASQFTQRGSEATFVVQAKKEETLSSASVQKALLSLMQEVKGVAHVASVEEPSLTPSQDGAAGLGKITFDQPPSELKESAEALSQIASREHPFLEVAFGGEAISMNQEPEPGAAEGIGLLAALLILLFGFGSGVAALLPIGTALVSVFIGIVLTGLAGRFVPVSSAAPMISTMLGLGVGIDYALFLITRVREEVARGLTRPLAIGRAVGTAGSAVFFAGVSVGIAILGLAFSGVGLIAAMGAAAAVVVFVSVAAALTLLPALLGLLGERLESLRVPRLGGDGTFFARFARKVALRPVMYGLLSGLILLVGATPALSLRLGFPDDGAQPEGSSARRAYDLISKHFGPGLNGPLVIAVELHGDAEAPAKVAQAAQSAGDVAMVAPPVLSPSQEAALVVAFPKESPQDESVSRLVRELRTDILPKALSGSPAKASIGGVTAITIDASEIIARRLPLVMVVVLISTFFLLLLVFRSVLVPLKAVFMNLLSVGASYGVLVAVFQWGYGRELLGLSREIPIVSLLPMLLFALLFGLSMDYEVFLLMRVQEEHEGGEGAVESVAKALVSTGRVVSAAALIMVTVFASFALGPDPMIKMFGVGLAAAIFLDATLIRLILVPATLVLLGEANWWLPGWLAKRLPELSLK